MRRFLLFTLLLSILPLNILQAQNDPLREIQLRFGVKFVYDSAISQTLSSSKSVTLPQGSDLATCLNEALKGTGIKWRKSGDYVILKADDLRGERPVSGKKVTISGHITDSQTGETLIGAGVTTGSIGAATNNFGFYTLTLKAGKHQLLFAYVGYEDKAISADFQKDTVINVALTQSGRLNAAKIVSRKDAGIQSSYMGAIEIPNELIANTPVALGEPDVLKTVQLMPGVQSGMEGFTGIYVRGGGPDENLFLLDGVPIYNVNHLFGVMSVFTPEAVKKVTLYKGSFPTRYGGRISSVVDVRSIEGNNKEFHGSVSVGLLSDKVHFEGPVGSEKTTWSLSARGMHTVFFDRLIKWFGSPLNYYFYDLNGKLTHRISDSDKLILNLYHGRDFFNYSDEKKKMSILYDEDYKPYKRSTSDLTKYKVGYGNTVAALSWNHIFSNTLFSNATVSWNQYKMNIRNNGESSVKDPTTFTYSKSSFDYGSGIRDIGARMDLDWTPSPRNLVKFGGEAILHQFRPETNRITQKEIDGKTVLADTTFNDLESRRINGAEISLYAEDDISLGEHLSLNPGIRLTLFSVQGKPYWSLQPRVSARYELAKGWAAKAAYSRMSQYVHLLTSGSLSLPTDLWVPITKNIKPVLSDLTSLGFYYDGLQGWEFSVEGYWKKARNVLEYSDGKLAFATSNNWEDNVSMGEGRSYGIELYAQKTAGKTTGTLSYTLAKSERVFGDGSINNGVWFPYKYDRRHNFAICVNHKFSKRVDVTGIWAYASGECMTVPERESFVIIPDSRSNGGYGTIDTYYLSSRNNYRLPASHRLDVNINLRKQKRRGERIWALGVYNLYNAHNPNWVTIDYIEDLQEDYSRGPNARPVLNKNTFLTIMPTFSYTFKF